MIIQDMDIVMTTMLMLDEVKDGVEIVANLFKQNLEILIFVLSHKMGRLLVIFIGILIIPSS